MSKDNDNKYLVGRDGWLFLSNDTNRVLDQVTGRFSLPENFGDRWAVISQYRADVFKQLGIQYGFLIAPNKECVFPEFLPQEVILSDRRPVFTVLKRARPFVKISYPIEALLKAKGAAETYSKGDTHWCLPGALIAARDVLTKLDIATLQEDNFEYFATSRGDLSQKLGQTNKYLEGRIKKPSFRQLENNNIPNIGNLQRFDNPEVSTGKCVMFRDSFGTMIIEIMAQTFQHFVAVWQPNIDFDLIKTERPDFVISQQAERFLPSIPDDRTGKSHLDYVREKLTLNNGPVL